MKKLVLYGAGIKGRKTAQILSERGKKIIGFCDSFKKETKINVREGIIPLIELEELIKKPNEYQVIITIGNYRDKQEVAKNLKEYGIEIINTEKVFSDSLNRVEVNREFIAKYHDKYMEEYYDIAEGGGAMDFFWNENRDVYPLFHTLDLKKVVELACGHERHVPQYIKKAEEIILVDVVQKNINFCKNRFPNENKIKYYANNGYNLCEIEDESCTSLFTYDSMIHFELLDIFNYLKETYRILVHGGKALFHHSNNTEDCRITFSTATQGHNFMSREFICSSY